MTRVFSHLGVDRGFVAPSLGRRVHEGGTVERMTAESARILATYLDEHWFAGLRQPEKRTRRAEFMTWFDRYNVVPDDHRPEVGDAARRRLIDVFLPDAERLAPVMGGLPPWVRRRDDGTVVWRGR